MHLNGPMQVCCMMIISITGCVGMSVSPEEQMASNGERNLAAIRALANHTLIQPSGRVPSDGSGAWPPDWYAPFHSSDQLKGGLAEFSNGASRSFSERRIPNSTATRGRRLYFPWRPAGPPAAPTSEPFRPVPPHVSFSPGPPPSPGGWRCVPDFSGGQRCHPH
jgi:hypothetical protein